MTQDVQYSVGLTVDTGGEQEAKRGENGETTEGFMRRKEKLEDREVPHDTKSSISQVINTSSEKCFCRILTLGVGEVNTNTFNILFFFL